jgi:hypothetical protein
MELTNKQYTEIITETVGRAHGYFDWRAQQHLGVALPNVPEKHYEHTPLALSVRAILDHVTGVAPCPDTIRDSCQLVCEALFVAPGNAGGEYLIPESFWETLLGQAITEAIGARADLPNDAIIEAAVACQIAGVSRQTLLNWRESGRLKAVDKNGETGGYRYRAGDVRATLKP